jgi:hypothetical protein
MKPKRVLMTTIVDDAQDYESWLGGFTELHQDDLDFKHARMSHAVDPFPFFRGTYFRWLRLWDLTCPEFQDAPHLLAVGDLHVENFGTWRDREGRLAWGVNDFDESFELPYTMDLVRLACSVKFARETGPLGVRNSQACEAILKGYRETLELGGRPFVLEEGHPHLRSLAYAQERDPGRFWKRLTKLLETPAPDVPPEARETLLRDMPAKKLECHFRHRPRIGMGSLGRPRFIVFAQWSGGWVAREAKALAPSASRWLAGKTESTASKIAEIVKKAVRCHDPFYRAEKSWIARRLGPRCNRIELAVLNDMRDQSVLLEAMGAETANVHLGSAKAIDAVLKDLENRPADWLCQAAKRMYKAVRSDWKDWRASTAKNKKEVVSLTS